MKLYYTPGACSLADHIALYEAGMDFDTERVDLKAKTTATGQDYTQVNPKGYVPALALDDGGLLTENIAILDWIADRAPQLRPEGALGRTRLLEMLAYISTELHKSFKPFFVGGSETEQAMAGAAIAKRFQWLADQLDGDFLFGSQFSVADAYLFVMLTWAKQFDLVIPDVLASWLDRVQQREAVQRAMRAEGLA